MDSHLFSDLGTEKADMEAYKEIAEIMGREIKGSKVIAILDAGHMMNIEKPEEFNTTLLNFINSIE